MNDLARTVEALLFLSAEPVSVERLGAVLGRVPPGVMAQVDDALRLHLQL